MRKSEKLRKLTASALLSLLLISNAKEAFADGDIYNCVSKVGEPEYGEQLLDKLYTLPKGIQNYLVEKNINIVLLESDYGAEECWLRLAGYSLGTSIRGFTDTLTNTIYVESGIHKGYYERYSSASEGLTKEEFSYRLAKDTLFHEIGHFFDRGTNSDLSQSYEFEQIFYAEVNNYLNTEQYKVDNFGIYVNISTPIEYFASAYACYVSYPESLKENCPMTYEYINNYMTQLNEQYSKEDKVLVK